MSFFKRLLAKSNKSTTQSNQVPEAKDELIRLLGESLYKHGDDLKPYKKKIMNQGKAGLDTLKNISLDDDIEDVNIRKQAIIFIAQFPGDEQANFIAENFINGRIPSELNEAYENGTDQSSFPILLQAKECLEQLGYSVG